MTALAMLKMGADQNTYAELDRVVEDRPLVLSTSKEVTARVVNSIWSEMKLRDQYVTDLASFFNADVHKTLDYKVINAYVEAHTENMIKNLLKNPLPDDMVAVLINAIYFKAQWKKPFKKSSTRIDAPFLTEEGKASGKTCELMTTTYNSLRYAKKEKWTAGSLPYKDDSVCATFVVPNNGFSIDEVLSEVQLSDLTQLPFAHDVDVSIPKFNISWGDSLVETLQTMGIKSMFKEAGFSKIHPDMFVTDVIHRAVLEMDEEGTEAAAATFIVLENCCSFAPRDSLRADRPFILFIHQGNNVLFAGAIRTIP